MNDFLTRVVRRHRGEVATVQPRPAPLYALDLEPAGDQFSEEFTWVQPPPTSAAERTTPARPEHRATATRETRPRLDPANHPVVDRLVEVQASTGRPDRESDAQAPRGQDPTGETQPITGERRPGPDRTVPAASAPQPDLASRAVASVAPRIVTERVTRTERVDVVPRLVRQDIPAGRPSDAPPSLVAAQRPAGRPSDVGDDTAEPPVHVSIGRIEVTAVAAPPAPTRKTTPRQPSMSLHEYLVRRQAKGGSS